MDLPADTTELAGDAGDSDDSLPGKAFHVRNDGGERGFMGAAPPEGDQVHRYYFVLHAVSEPSLGVDADASRGRVVQLAFKTLGRATARHLPALTSHQLPVWRPAHFGA